MPRLSLSELDAEGGPKREPFEVELPNGTVVTLTDPRDLTYRQILDLDSDDVGRVMLALLGDSYDEFADADLRNAQLEKMMDGYYKHFGLGRPGRLAGSRRS